MKNPWRGWFGALFLVLVPTLTHADEVRLSLERLKSKLKVTTLTVDDPVYKTKKTYEGFRLKDVLEAEGLRPGPSEELMFVCADGYSPTMASKDLDKHRGLIAFREKGRKDGWQKFKQGKKTMTPAPFYLVWDSSAPELQWPYQLVAMKKVSLEERYGEIFPSGLKADSRERMGFETFRKECLKCHSLNLRGGELGPELNHPQNITEYRESSFLKAFIRNPGTFRARSTMPAFPQLKDEEIDRILTYLRWVKGRKKPSDR